jgi:hypothetical protein
LSRITSTTRVTEAGEAFLKTATAAPDFSNTELHGIPDEYTGRTITKRDYVYIPFVAPAGNTTYIVVTPTAGVSHYQYTTSFGADLADGATFQGINFPDANQIFPGVGTNSPLQGITNNSQIVDKGRLALLSAELVVLNNSFSQFGSIAAYKTPLSLTIGLDDGSQAAIIERYSLTGVQALASTVLNAEAYVQPVRDGAYSVSMNREAESPFMPVAEIMSDATNIPGTFTRTSDGQVKSSKWLGAPVCWDNGFDSIVFRIDVPAGGSAPFSAVDQSFTLKVWKAWEYQPVFNSLLYTLASLSPQEDHSAMRLYREIERQLPVAVPARDNPDFWNTVLGMVDKASNAISVVPGGIGDVAKGVHAVTSLFTKKKKGGARKTPRKMGTTTVTARKSKPGKSKSSPRKGKNRR